MQSSLSDSKSRTEQSRAYSLPFAPGSSHCFECPKSMIVTPESLTRILSRRISPWSMPARWMESNVDRADLLTEQGEKVQKLKEFV
jgi:hypothetical protein